MNLRIPTADEGLQIRKAIEVVRLALKNSGIDHAIAITALTNIIIIISGYHDITKKEFKSQLIAMEESYNKLLNDKSSKT